MNDTTPCPREVICGVCWQTVPVNPARLPQPANGEKGRDGVEAIKSVQLRERKRSQLR